MGKLDQSPSLLSRRDFLRLGAQAAAMVGVAVGVPGLLHPSQVDASPVETVAESHLGIRIEGPSNFIADMKDALDLLSTSYYDTPEKWNNAIGVTSSIIYDPKAANTHAGSTKSFLEGNVSIYDPIWQIVVDSMVYNYYTDPALRKIWLASVLAHEAKHLSAHRAELIAKGVPNGEWSTDCWIGPNGELRAYKEELEVMKALGAPRDMQQLDIEQLNKMQYQLSQKPYPGAALCAES